MATQSEFDNMLSYLNVSDKTLTNYNNTYKRLMKITKDKPLKLITDEELIKLIDAQEISISAKITLLIVAINIYATSNRDKHKLTNYRNILNDRLKIDKAEKAKQPQSISVSKLKKFLDELLVSKSYNEYVVNYLMINLGVRNKDLDAIITTDEELVDDVDNWLLIKPNGSIEYIRNDYKTASQYGQKRHLINDKSFYEAVKALNKNKASYDSKDGVVYVDYLLSKKNGERIKNSSIGNIVRRMTYEDVGEAEYFKTIVSNADKKQTEYLSASRGTSVGVIQTFYDRQTENYDGQFKSGKAVEMMEFV